MNIFYVNIILDNIYRIRGVTMGDKKELVKKIVYKFVELSNVIDKSLIEKYIEKLCLLEVDDIIDSIMISLNDLFNRKVLTVEQILSNSDMIIALNPQKYHSADDLINRLEYFTKKDYISKNIKYSKKRSFLYGC